MDFVVRHENENLVHTIPNRRNTGVHEAYQVLVSTQIALQNEIFTSFLLPLFIFHSFTSQSKISSSSETMKKLTVIWISRLQTARSCSLLTYMRLRAYFELLLPFTRNTIANPPGLVIRRKNIHEQVTKLRAAKLKRRLRDSRTFGEDLFHNHGMLVDLEHLSRVICHEVRCRLLFILIFKFRKYFFHLIDQPYF